MLDLPNPSTRSTPPAASELRPGETFEFGWTPAPNCDGTIIASFKQEGGGIFAAPVSARLAGPRRPSRSGHEI